MAWEWMLVGFVWLGIRKRMRLRELIGGRWATVEDFFLDLVYAGAFWVCAMFVLGLGAKLMHLDQAGKIEDMRRQIGFLAPESRTGTRRVVLRERDCRLLRGDHLPRISAAAVRRHRPTRCSAGVLLSAIVFGASHGYEGARAHDSDRNFRINVWVTRVVAKEPAPRNDGARVARRIERRSFANAAVLTTSSCRTEGARAFAASALPLRSVISRFSSRGESAFTSCNDATFSLAQNFFRDASGNPDHPLAFFAAQSVSSQKVCGFIHDREIAVFMRVSSM